MADTNDTATATRSDSTAGRNRASDAFDAARERTRSAYAKTRDRAGELTSRAGQQIAVYPVAAVIGGFALGALVAAFLPRTRREEELLGETGRKITGAARDAAQRGLDAGKEQVEQIRSRATQKVGEAVVEAIGGGKD